MIDTYQCLHSQIENEIVRDGPCPMDGLLRGPSSGWDPLLARQAFRGRRERPYTLFVPCGATKARQRQIQEHWNEN